MKSIWRAAADPRWRSQFDSRVIDRDGDIKDGPSLSNRQTVRKTSKYYQKDIKNQPKPIGRELSFQKKEEPVFPNLWTETYSEKKTEFKPKIRRVTKDGIIIEKKE